jgi:hypothetical protein
MAASSTTPDFRETPTSRIGEQMDRTVGCSTSAPPATFSGPCYLDTDTSFAKEQSFNIKDQRVQVRFQANFYNIFNKTNLQPITFGAPEATIENSLFGLSPGADAGRVLEFFARLEF